jgi:hypothetical protein
MSRDSEENLVDDGTQDKYNHTCIPRGPSPSFQRDVNVSFKVTVHRNIP